VLASMDPEAKEEVETAVKEVEKKVADKSFNEKYTKQGEAYRDVSKIQWENKNFNEKKMKAKDFAGVTAPLGYWDPFGITTRIPPDMFGVPDDWVLDWKVPERRFLFIREAELKHGRVCMLASLGILVSEKFHPLFGGDIDVPAYRAFQETPLQTFWLIVLAAIGYLETPAIKAFIVPSGSNAFSLRTDRIPGDLGFDPLGLKPKDPEELKKIQTKELNNGRLAMIATAGMIAQELVDGQKLFK